MAITQFLSSRYVLVIHMVQLFLVMTVIILAVVRIFLKGGQLRRNDTMALSMVSGIYSILMHQI